MSGAIASESDQQAGHVAGSVGQKVFAGNLAYAVTDESLKSFFSPVADDIISVQVIMRGTRSAGYGFVTVKTLEVAQKACEKLDKTELLGRQVVVEVAKPADQKDKERTERRDKRRTGRARGRAPPGEVTEAEATGDTDKPNSAGSITDAAANGEDKQASKKKRVNRKKPKKSADKQDAPTQADEAKHNVDSDTAVASKKAERPARAKRAPRPAGEDPVGEPSKTVLFVANLGFNVDDAALADLFTSAGINVVSARVVRRRWGKPRKSKGYGFVDVGGEEEQKKAIAAVEGKEVEGRPVAVKVAVNADRENEADDEHPGTNGTHARIDGESPEATIVAQ